MRIQPWWIEPYALRIVGVSGVVIAWLFWRNRQLKVPALSLGLLGITVAALLLGRAGYVVSHAAYFSQNPGDIIDFRHSAGIHGLAALGGALLGTTLWIAFDRPHAGVLLRLLLPASLWIAAGAWGACLGTGSVWGRTVSDPEGLARWVVTPAPDLYRTVELRVAVPELAMIWSAASAVLAGLLRERGFYILPIYLAGMSGLSLFRADPVFTLGTQRLDTVLYAALALVCTSMTLALLLSSTDTARTGAAPL